MRCAKIVARMGEG